MHIFLTNLSCVLLTLVCITVFSCVSASDVVVDTKSKRLMNELSHVTDIAASLIHSYHRSDDTCQEAVKQLTEKVTKYTECSSQYALNAGMCEQCVEYYLNAANQLATNFSAITDEFGRPCSVRLMMTEGAVLVDKLKRVISSWKELNCHHCYVNETTKLMTNETIEFAQLLKLFYACVSNASQGRVREPFTLTNGTLNTSACEDCHEVYHQLNHVFVTMGTQHRNTVCADTVKLMSYTRRLWNDMLLCRRAKVDSIELLLVASFLTLLPITFYVASYINSPDISSNILQQKRLRDSSSATLRDSSSATHSSATLR